jgi:hypothetical protein
VGVDTRNREMTIEIKNLNIFDYIILQPNYYQKKYNRNIEDLKLVNELCKKEGIGIEIEFDERIFEKDKIQENKALEYFNYVENDLIGYYMGYKAFPMCASRISPFQRKHPIYEKIIEKIERGKRSESIK